MIIAAYDDHKVGVHSGFAVAVSADLAFHPNNFMHTL